MSGPEIAAEVAAAIIEAAEATGSGALTGTITRAGTIDDSTHPPTVGAPVDYACTLLWDTYSAYARATDAVKADDVRAYVSPDAETAPRIGDKLTEGGKTFHIVNVSTLRPGGTALLYECQCRASNGN